jgi:SAM-dependent methyltransferase
VSVTEAQFEPAIVQRLTERYDSVAAQWGSTWPHETSNEATQRQRIERSVMDLAQPAANEQVVDLGTGRRARYAAYCARAGASVVALDLSPVVLRAAASYVAGEPWARFITFRRSGGLSLPLPDDSVDLVVCSEVLEYWPPDSVVRLLAEILRVLAPTGRAVVDLPRHEDPEAIATARREAADGADFFTLPTNEHRQVIAAAGLCVAQERRAGIEMQYLLCPNPSNERTVSVDAPPLLRRIYKRSAEWLLRTHGLVGISTRPVWSRAATPTSGIAFAVNSDLPDTWIGEPVVVGGSCLGYSDGRPDKLRLDVAVDSLMPILVAAHLGCDCLLFMHVEEEEGAIAAAGARGYGHVADAVQALIESAAATMHPTGTVAVLRTDTGDREAVDRAEANLGHSLSDSSLARLYAIGSSGRAASPSPSRLRLHRRTVLSYLPDVVGAVLNRRVDQVVAVENLHQVKAVRTAGRLAMCDSRAWGRVDHLVLVPPPSLTASSRMCRARPSSSLRLVQGVGALRQAIHTAHPLSRNYWLTAFALLDLDSLLARAHRALRATDHEECRS